MDGNAKPVVRPDKSPRETDALPLGIELVVPEAKSEVSPAKHVRGRRRLRLLVGVVGLVEDVQADVAVLTAAGEAASRATDSTHTEG